MLERLQTMIREYKGDNDIVIAREQILIADLDMNSLDLMELVCQVEEEFNVEIPDRAIREFKTVGDVIDYIEKQ